MQKIPLYWIFLIGLPWTSSALAAAGITISAVEASAWMLQGDSKTALATGDEIRIETRLLTDASGKLAVRLEPGASLQLDVNSEIELVAKEGAEIASAASLSEIKIHRGHACAQFLVRPDAATRFNLLLGDSVRATIHEQGEICVTFNRDSSSIVLNKGSVQITNLIEPAMAVLSEEGSEYRFDDTGYFELGKVETAISIEIRNKAASGPATQTLDRTTASTNQTGDASEHQATAKDTPGVSQAPGGDTASGYVYTVYLFSTRSQQVANELNQRLLDAGHDTLIIISEDGSVTRYRIAVSGFASRRAAQDFADAIVGSHGIADTWIGRQKIIQ